MRLAKAANVGRLVVFHHEPGRNDDALDALAIEAKAMFTGAEIAREGDTLRP
jgi:ribonuclease BN (tRNA processing enzyme)